MLRIPISAGNVMEKKTDMNEDIEIEELVYKEIITKK